jgi:hypothetical protein
VAGLQLAIALTVGVPLMAILRRKRATELMWFVGGLLTITLGFFALRTVH